MGATTAASPASIAEPRSEGFERVRAVLQTLAHGHDPLWLTSSARSAQEAADVLGVALGQIAKSVVFRRKSDDGAVLVIAAGDRRVDERKLQVHTGPLGRADADFVKARTGFSIGGVSPLGFAPAQGWSAPQLFIDETLFRFDTIWAAAGHPNGVFQMTPQQLVALTGAPVVEVMQS
ncbi:Cys-tRNA(Pro) deacylase, prolyl-tRNA editing enzyme YbaK/EbsC [Roseateles sp. YR242]|uniref:YbaK/EbsC family protein n=1 Tax=Roseateles sp. YR242 TaxID=1855305 RepID=UPI0008BB34E8|nr:YbaK/EbsC family protein [Roseateles sp. YR242]SEK36875.1 Cys-tRNA(Pro) deacylase, prolyl-tRNA editing enzyme YbaK/EbsC [Roseateles sp. YR242]